MSIETSSKSITESIPRNLLPTIVDVYRDGKNAYDSVEKIPLSWVKEKFAKSGMPKKQKQLFI